jgi:mono/diheme cytochrome c family protein
MRPNSKWGLGVAMLISAALPAALQAQTPPPLPTGVTQQMVEQGRALFAAAGNCFACHGPNGAGTPLAPKLDDAQWLHIDGSYPAIVDLIIKGVPMPKASMVPMAPKGGSTITDDQVKQVAAYVWRISHSN